MAILKDGGSPEDEARSQRFGIPTAGEWHLAVFYSARRQGEAVFKAFLLHPEQVSDLSPLSALFRVWGRAERPGLEGRRLSHRIYTVPAWESPQWEKAKAEMERMGATRLPDAMDEPQSGRLWAAACLAAVEARALEAGSGSQALGQRGSLRM